MTNNRMTEFIDEPDTIRNEAVNNRLLIAEQVYEAIDELMRKKDVTDNQTTTNYNRLFGTPERAAQTLEDACSYCDGELACDDCVIGRMRGFRDTKDEVEEWLRM